MIKEYYQILDSFSGLYELLDRIQRKLTNFNTYDVHLIGGRYSAKTYSVLRFAIEFSFTKINTVTTIIRNEPQGATQTGEELNSLIYDFYDLDPKINHTLRKVQILNNQIKVIGILSNRKKKVAKLGLARLGINKQVQINIFEECSEIDDQKTIEMVKQATGGSNYVINFFISNPGISSHGYVKQFIQLGLFNKKALETSGEFHRVLKDPENKKMTIFHVSNHRVNTKLSEAQHNSLTELGKIADPNFAAICDLGLPGTSEGLIYAPILHKIQYPIPLTKDYEVDVIQGGLDWGTSTGPNGSAVALVLGKISKGSVFLQIEKEYYHSNSKMHYLDDNALYNEVLENIMAYVKENIEIIKAKRGMIIYYDNAAFGIGSALENLLQSKYPLYSNIVEFRKCVKYDVPIRVDVVKHIISSNRFRMDKSKCPHLFEHLEIAQGDETKKVKDRPTRLKENDDMLDAMEYMMNNELLDMIMENYLLANKGLGEYVDTYRR